MGYRHRGQALTRFGPLRGMCMVEIAVLSGGLDNFEANEDVRHQRLAWLLGELGARYGAQTAFVGDGFQIGLRQPLAVCECALFIRAGLLAVSPSRRERWDRSEEHTSELQSRGQLVC